MQIKHNLLIVNPLLSAPVTFISLLGFFLLDVVVIFIKMEFGIQVDDLQVQAIFIDPDNYLFELRKVIIEDELQVPDNFVFLSKSGRLISRQQEKRLKVLSVSDGEKMARLEKRSTQYQDDEGIVRRVVAPNPASDDGQRRSKRSRTVLSFTS